MKTNATTSPFQIPETPALAAARAALNAIQVRIFECVEKRDTKQAHIFRLAAQNNVLKAAKESLEDFKIAQQLRIDEWNDNGSVGEAPRLDSKAREKLEKAVDDAEADQRCYDDVRARLSSELATLNDELRTVRAEEARARIAIVSAFGDAVATEFRARADEAQRFAVLVTSWRNYAFFSISDAELKRIASAAYLSATDHMKPENAAARLVLANVQSVSLVGDAQREFRQMESAWEVLFDLLATNASAKLFDEPKTQEADKAA